MSFERFPEKAKRDFDYNRFRELEQLERQKYTKIQQYHNRHTDYDYLKIIPFLFIGVIVGIAICSVRCMDDFGFENLLFIILIPILELILIMIIYLIRYSIDTSKNKSNAREISITNSNYYKKVNIINSKYDNLIKQYAIDFEKAIVLKSVDYANSDLAQDIIDLITKSMIEEINNADRSSHIQIINVSHIFNVYKDQITYGIYSNYRSSKYDFEINRCKNLTNELEQAALARAIATQVQVKIRMEFCKETTKIKPTITVNYEYTEEIVKTIIKYNIPNEMYKSVRSW